MKVRTFAELLRVEQWYKNLVVFFAQFFSKGIFDISLLEKTVLSFTALCLLSSSYYILNDIWGREADRRHPEKKRRPIASGVVSISFGYALSITLFVLSFAVALTLPPTFKAIMVLLFLSSLAYNLWLKDIAFLDFHVIAVNFLLRAIGGAVVIDVPASAWLITTVFFTAMLLGVNKRRAELTVLGEDAVKFRNVYTEYTMELLDILLVIISALLLVSYVLYTFFINAGGYMMLTIPFASFALFRYLQLTTDQSIRGKAHRMFLDIQIIVCFALWGITLFYILYILKI